MRDYRFRGKRLNNEEWVYGNIIRMDSSSSQSFIMPFCESASSMSCMQLVARLMVPILPKTIGQYTGLKDCKRTEKYPEGQKIYEGDVVEAFKHGDEEQRFELIVANHHCFMFGNWTIVEFVDKFRMVSVIGNIYENQELLEQLTC